MTHVHPHPLTNLRATTAELWQELGRPFRGEPASVRPPLDQRPLHTRRPQLPLAVFQLAGTEAEMGRQHGELLRDLGGWQDTLAYYPRMVSCVISGSRDHGLRGLVDSALPKAVAPAVEAALRRLHRRRPAAMRARSEAFYGALGLPPEHARYLGVMDVLQNVIGVAGRVGAGGISERLMLRAPAACSTLAVWGSGTADGELLHARNFDFPGSGVWEQAPAVVFCSPTDGLRYGFVTTRGADVPAVSVFNEAGVCLSIHTRFHRKVDFSGALAVDLCHQVARKAETLEQAVGLLERTHSASTWGVVVSSASERDAALVELHAGGAAVTRPRGKEPWLSCTNRYRHAALQPGELQPSLGFAMHSDGRFRSLERRAKAATEGAPLTAGDLQALLGDHTDCSDPNVTRATGGVLAQSNGVHAVVMDPSAGTVDVAVGTVPANHGPWVRVPWRFASTPSVDTLCLSDLRAEAARSHARVGHRYQRGATGEAYRCYLEAARVEMMAGPSAAAQQALEQACALDPREPSYRLLAAGFQLRAGAWRLAGRHLDAALAVESGAFERARLHLWAARVAAVEGRDADAAGHHRALQAGVHDHIAPYQAAGRTEALAPLRGRRLRQTQVQLQLGDLTL